MCNYVFSKLGMVSTDYISQDPRYMRAEELKYLRGDCSKIKKLGWKPKISISKGLELTLDWYIAKN